MKLILDPAQAMLAKTASDFANKHDPVDRQRQLRNDKSELGYSPAVWSEMADLGWTGIPFAEDLGGLGMGMAEAVLISESMGEALAPEPFISAVIFAGSLIEALGTTEQKQAWLQPTIEGQKRLAVAHQEQATRFDPAHCTTTAEQVDGGWRLTGTKAHVIDGYDANGWVVAARTSGGDRDEDGISLFIVAAGANGATCTHQARVDSRNASTLVLAGAPGELLGGVDGGGPALSEAIDRATVALCGEMLGMVREAFERTIEYLKTREQFGAKIGTFQALQHRAAEMFVEIELCKSVVMGAARTLDEDGDVSNRIAQVANAKARCSDTVILVTNEALQMHGGVGMTDEYDIGLFMKRARVCELTFGDASYQRNRFAKAQGF